MGWFDEQIKNRIKNDEDAFSKSFSDMSSAIMKKRVNYTTQDERTRAVNAMGDILKYFRVQPEEIPESLTELDEQLEYLLRPSGVMRRTIKLKEDWYKRGFGPLLGRLKNGTLVALLPHGLTGYAYFDHDAGKHIHITKKNADNIVEEGICFYRPLPMRSIGIRDLLIYIGKTLSLSDLILVVLACLAATLLGLFSPYVNSLLFGKVIPSGAPSLLLPLMGLMLGVTISTLLIHITQTIIMDRIQTKLSLSVQAASMMRIFSLPADFFKDFSSGELNSRIQSINSLCDSLVFAILSTGLTSIFSLIYIGQIFHYAPGLVAVSLLVPFFSVLLSLILTFLQMKRLNTMMHQSAKLSGLTLALFSGIQKLKLAGAERRAFAKWGSQYACQAKLQYSPHLILRLLPMLSTGVGVIGTLFIYWYVITTALPLSDYMAFNISYGMVSGSFLSLSSVALTMAGIKPTLNMIDPILRAVPEVAHGKRVLTRLSGGVEINNVTFRYKQDMPPVLDDLSLKIRPGQYVAIVGASGCGKSTLIRLILGFETPQKGAIYYDGKDIQSVDLRSLRRHIGVVMQTGKLFQGDIFSNITVSAPWLSVEDAWEAAELAGIAEDIREMPMGMHTVISDGSGGISGGQRQRLMIARAIASKPKLLMFDEATSALDNLTQKKVSQSLDNLKCTRIVIAHRLSTIRQCDRIIFLEKGKILEDGSYNDLMELNGHFAELVAHQRINSTPAAENNNDILN